MTETLTTGRVSGKDVYRLYELMALVPQPVATWTTPFQRAEEALRIAGRAMEFQDAHVARYAITVHLRFMRLLIEQFGCEEGALLARERAQVQAMVGAALEDQAMDFGGPDIKVTILDGPHGAELLQPADQGVMRAGGDLDRMAGERLV
jgi:hypothetical protein